MFLAVDELILSYREYSERQGLLATAAMPNVKVLKFDDILEDSAPEPNQTLQSLKSIFCGSTDAPSDEDRDCYIPADLGGIEELVFAARHPLHLVLGNGRAARERLNKLYIIAPWVTVSVLSLLDVNNALLSRGLTLRRAHHGSDLDCMYIGAISAPVLSYAEAQLAVDASLKRWGQHSSCAQCGACFQCLEEAGDL